MRVVVDVLGPSEEVPPPPTSRIPRTISAFSYDTGRSVSLRRCGLSLLLPSEIGARAIAIVVRRVSRHFAVANAQDRRPVSFHLPNIQPARLASPAEVVEDEDMLVIELDVVTPLVLLGLAYLFGQGDTAGEIAVTGSILAASIIATLAVENGVAVREMSSTLLLSAITCVLTTGAFIALTT